MNYIVNNPNHPSCFQLYISVENVWNKTDDYNVEEMNAIGNSLGIWKCSISGTDQNPIHKGWEFFYAIISPKGIQQLFWKQWGIEIENLIEK